MLRVLILAAVSTKVQSKEDRHSLPIQERDGRAFADRERGVVVDVLRIPGHTRRILDYAELKDRAARKGIDAFVKLEEHWRAKDFDVLWVRGGDRFARTQSVHARITEEIINAGARIYAADDGGWVDKSNYRYWIAMSGAKAAGSVDNFVSMTRKTKDGKAALGLAVNAKPIWSHKAIRDDYGKIKAVVPDRSKELVIRDAARLVVEGVGWHRLEEELRTRYGHTNNGVPFNHNHFYHLFYGPYFWGNSARRYRGATQVNGYRWDLWIFDASYPAPDGVLVYYGTHEPYLNDDLGSRLKAELIRRRSAIRGGARPYRSHPFTGLFVCAECGYAMTYHKGRSYAYYFCPLRHGMRGLKRACSGSSIRVDKATAWFDAELRLMLATQDPYHFFQTKADAADDAALLDAQLIETRRKAATLIQKQALADAALASLYDDQLQALADELRSLQARILEARQNVRAEEHAQAAAAYADIRALPDVSDIWQQSDTEINQLLHRLMGRSRIAVHKHDVQRIVEARG